MTMNLKTILLLLLLAYPAFAAKEDPSSLALMSLETRGIVDGSSIGVIQERLRNLFISRGNLDVCPLSKSEEYLNQKRISLPSMCKDDCIIQMGESLHASYVVIPAMTREPYGLAISLDLFDVKSGKIISSAKTSTQGELSGALNQAVQNLMDGAPALATESSEGLSQTTWTVLGISSSILLIGGFVLFNGVDDSKPASEPAAEPKRWEDTIQWQ
jgi:hypothetical protein